jgi:CubicO group peptidase (beta-lactamase class C family)
MKIIVSLLFASTLVLPVEALAENDQTDLANRVDKVFEAFDSTISPGCSLAVAKEGRIIYQRGYGMANLDHDVPITPRTVFHVASVSKQFTAAAVVLLAQDGKLTLDDEVRQHIPELPDFGKRITIRHLIHHTSGLRDQWSLLGLAGWRYSLDLITDEDVLYLVGRMRELNFPPGERYLYCNTGYTLLAQIVKRASGESFREFTSSRIFEPLGMENTFFRDDHAEVIKHQAYGYKPGKEKQTFRLSVTNFDTAGATSLHTTAEDLTRWAENFEKPKVGNSAFVAQLLEQGVLNSGEKLDYAFGLVVDKYRGLETISHSGGDAGYRSNFLYFPDQQFVVSCLCNISVSQPSSLNQKVADVYLEAELEELGAKPESEEIELEAEELARFVGLFWNEDDESPIRFELKEGRLTAGSTGEKRWDMKATGGSSFEFVELPVTVEFKDSDSGNPDQVVVKAPWEKEPTTFDRSSPYKPTPSELEELAGNYRSEEIGLTYYIEAEEGDLVLRRLKAKADKLEPLVQKRFGGSIGIIRFERDGEDRVIGMILDTGRVKNFRFLKVQ